MTYGQTKRTKRERRIYEAFGWIIALFFASSFASLLMATTFACLALSTLTAVASCYGLFEVAKVLRAIDQEIRDGSASRQILPPRGGTDKAHNR